jgi:hypothetical protein
MTLREQISKGLDGHFQGLANGFTRINELLFFIQRATYYLFGGLSGAAKTTLVDFMLHHAIDDADNQSIPLEVFYYSYEIPENRKKISWLSNHIYKKFGVSIHPKVIQGKGNFRMTIEEQELVDSEIEHIDEIFKRINFRFEPTNPTGIWKELWDYAEANGKFEYEKYTTHEGKEGKRIVRYTPNNPEAYVFIVIDHIYLAKLERGFTRKENIDKLSEYFIFFRNICGYTIFAVQQFNQGLNNVERAKFKDVDLSPNQGDFKDSTNPYQDCDVAIGVMNPFKMDFKEYMDYDLTKLGSSFRLFKIMKNREEEDNVCYGLYFKGSAGTFTELPLPLDLEMNINGASYDNYI